MNEPLAKYIQTIPTVNDKPSNFQSIFFKSDMALRIRVPDYQRAFSWEQKQTDLFLSDLVKYQGSNEYYFGHFIAENVGEHWEIVDGQQRLTTFVLFLMVCRILAPAGDHAFAFSLIEQFETVSYDAEALKTIACNLGEFLEAYGDYDEKKPPSDEQIIKGLFLTGTFTRSQKRMALALLRFYQAFHDGKKKGGLEKEKIGAYIAAVMSAHCSHHLTQDKSVAVNIFEMHNTRGIPLTTLEIIKAMLIKFVYDYGGETRQARVEQIQAEFGEIYGMEEAVAAASFRGEMTMEQLLRMHLRVVDDGKKENAQEFDTPAINANPDALVAYVDSRLRFMDGNESHPKALEEGVQYALRLAKELKKSVQIISQTLPAWDAEDRLVGDVLILERELSCQFFLIVCRRLESAPDNSDGRLGNDTLKLWEKLLFTRNFHGAYHGKHYGDNFPKLFASCEADGGQITNVIKGYLANGFRGWDVTNGLQNIVTAYLHEHRDHILNGAFYWWKSKMIYAIFKFEISRGAKLRDVMKGTISVEHILPQEWQWDWIDGYKELSPAEKEVQKVASVKEVDLFINGIGNLLLVTPGENTSVGNKHPAEKIYGRYSDGGSYKEHDLNREQWRSSKQWAQIVRDRGEKIFDFMLSTLVDSPQPQQTSSSVVTPQEILA